MNSGIPVYAPVWTYMIEGNGTPLSINEHLELSNIMVFPNPAKSILYVSCLNCNDSFYEIYNLQGQVVLSGKTQSTIIDISHLNLGVYILKINQDNILKTIKIVKE